MAREPKAQWVTWTFTWKVIGGDIFEQPIRGSASCLGCTVAFQQALDFWGLEWDQIELIHVEGKK